MREFILEKEFSHKGSTYKLAVTGVSNWEDAEKELEAEKHLTDDSDKYIAVIIDAKCKVGKDDPDDMEMFLSEVRVNIQ